jgi:hypothetical protein
VDGRGVGSAVVGGTGRADAVGDGAGTPRAGSGTGVASSSLPASLSPAGSSAPVGSGTGTAVALGTGAADRVHDGTGTGAAVALGTGAADRVHDGTGTGVATGPPDAVGIAVGEANLPEGTGTGVAGTGVAGGDVATPTCPAGPSWACPVAAIAAVPPPMRASPVTPAITQARLTRGRLLLDSM